MSLAPSTDRTSRSTRPRTGTGSGTGTSLAPGLAPGPGSGPDSGATARGRLRVVTGPDRSAPDAPAQVLDPAPTTGADAEAPPLRLRVLPQAMPEAWHPARTTPDGDVHACQRPRHQQQTLVLHGLPHAVVEPDPDEPTTDVADLPCPEQLARRLVQAAVDVVRGHRPASQVLRWTTPEVYSQLRQRARLEQAAGRTGGRRPVVRSLRSSRCGERGVEVSAVVLDGNRARAVAARLDAEDSRWRLTALVIG